MRKIARKTGLISLYHYAWALGSAILYGFPGKDLVVIGVTGTKGKTTTISLLKHIFEYAGHPSAMVTSSDICIEDQCEKNLLGNSMPGRFFLQKFLARAKRAGVEYVFVEVTSEGVRFFRNYFLHFSGAVFLNLTKEHIESHGSFEKYKDAKLSFFRRAKKENSSTKFFINKNDYFSSKFLLAAGGQAFIFEKSDLESQLFGEHNKCNIGAATSVAHAFDINESLIEEATASFPGVSGRMDLVFNKDFKVFVDYAHTPDSLWAALVAGEEQAKKNILVVIGAAGGGRDRWKRKEIGKVAATFANTVVITNEDPFDEDPRAIMEEINAGALEVIEKKDHVRIIEDRKEAILFALKEAKKGDVVLVTGKGSEPWIRVKNGKKIPWSDHQIIHDFFKK